MPSHIEMIYAEAFSNSTQDKKTIVEKFGTEGVKSHFAKYGKFKNPNTEDVLIKTLNQYFESVEKVKQGRVVKYQLGNTRAEIADRVDGRIRNGHTAMSYKENLDIIVVSTLMSDKIANASYSMNTWLNKFGFIDDEMHELISSRIGNGKRPALATQLEANGVLDCNSPEGADKQISGTYLLSDYIHVQKDLKGHLESSLNRMKKSGIIEFYEVYKAMTLDGNMVQLTDEAHKLISQTKSRVAEENGLLPWMQNVEVVNKPEYKEGHKRFKQEFQEFLEKGVEQQVHSGRPPELIRINYYWKAHAIFLKNTKDAILKHLQKYNDEAIEFYLDNKNEFVNQNVTVFQDERKNVVYNNIEKMAYKSFPEKISKKLVSGFGKNVKYSMEDTNKIFRDLYMENMHRLESFYGDSFKSILEHKKD